VSEATDKTNLADLRRRMTLWHNRVTALGFDGVADLIALAETGSDEIKNAWPISERISLKLMMIKQIGEGSTTANSLPHVARIAGEALQLIHCHPTSMPDAGESNGIPAESIIALAHIAGIKPHCMGAELAHFAELVIANRMPLASEA